MTCVCLCVCVCVCGTGLVMPKFARSKAEMVAAGVIPIDRLTEIRSPVEVVAERCGRGQVGLCVFVCQACACACTCACASATWTCVAVHIYTGQCNPQQMRVCYQRAWLSSQRSTQVF